MKTFEVNGSQRSVILNALVAPAKPKDFNDLSRIYEIRKKFRFTEEEIKRDTAHRKSVPTAAEIEPAVAERELNEWFKADFKKLVRLEDDQVRWLKEQVDEKLKANATAKEGQAHWGNSDDFIETAFLIRDVESGAYKQEREKKAEGENGSEPVNRLVETEAR